jgi:hypothetical protein
LGAGAHARRGIREAIFKDKKLGAAAVELARRATRAGVEGAAVEGITEGLQELTNIAGMRWAKDDPLFAELTDEDWSQLANAAAAGALVGGVAAGSAGPFRGVPQVPEVTERGTPPGAMPEAIPPATEPGQELAPVILEGEVIDPARPGPGTASPYVNSEQVREGASAQTGTPAQVDPLTGEFIPGERPANIVPQPSREGITIEGVRARKNQLTQQLALAGPVEAIQYREELTQLEQLEKELALEAEQAPSMDPNDFELTPQQPIPRREAGPREQTPTAQQGELPGMETQGAFNFDSLNEQTEMDFVFGEVDQTTRGKPYASRESAEKAARVLQKNGKLQTFEVVEEKTSTGSKFVIQDKGPEIKAKPLPEVPEALREWDRTNRMHRSDSWFEGAHADEAARRGFAEAVEVGGDVLQAHGMAKERTAGGGLNNLLGILRDGLDPSRRKGKLDTAGMVSKKDVNAGPGLGTPSGSAYSDGPFMLVAKPGQGLEGNLSGLGAVLVNQAHAGQINEIKQAIHAVRPDIQVELYENAGKVASNLLSEGTQAPQSAVVLGRDATGEVAEIESPLNEESQDRVNLERAGQGSFEDTHFARGISNNPFKNIGSARAAARRAGLEHAAVVEQDGGYVIKAWPGEWTQATRKAADNTTLRRTDTIMAAGRKLARQIGKKGFAPEVFEELGLTPKEGGIMGMPSKNGATLEDLSAALHEAGYDVLGADGLPSHDAVVQRFKEQLSGDRMRAYSQALSEQEQAEVLGLIPEPEPPVFTDYEYPENAEATEVRGNQAWVDLEAVKGFNGAIEIIEGLRARYGVQEGEALPFEAVLDVEEELGKNDEPDGLDFFSQPKHTVRRTAQEVRDSLSQVLGSDMVARLEKMGLLYIHEGDHSSRASGFWSTKLGRIQLNAAYMPENGSPLGVFLHEGAHAGLDFLLGGKLKEFVKDITRLAERNDPIAKAALDAGFTEASSRVEAMLANGSITEAQVESMKSWIMQEEAAAYYIQMGEAEGYNSGVLNRMKNSLGASWAKSPIGRLLGVDMTGGTAVGLANQALNETLALVETLDRFQQMRLDSAPVQVSDVAVAMQTNADRLYGEMPEPIRDQRMYIDYGLVKRNGRWELVLGEKDVFVKPNIRKDSVKTLGDIVDSPKMFAAAPDLKDLQVSFVPVRGDVMKVMDGKVFLSNRFETSSASELRSALLRGVKELTNKTWTGFDVAAPSPGLAGIMQGLRQQAMAGPTKANERLRSYLDSVMKDPELAPKAEALVQARMLRDKIGRMVGDPTQNAALRRQLGLAKWVESQMRKELGSGVNQLADQVLVSEWDVPEVQGRSIEDALDEVREYRVNEMPFALRSMAENVGGLWRSALIDTVVSAKQDKAAPAQWKGWLQNQPGVKKEEMEDMGLGDWLDAQEGVVTREEVEGFVQAGGVKLEEVVKGEGHNLDALREELREVRIEAAKAISHVALLRKRVQDDIKLNPKGFYDDEIAARHARENKERLAKREVEARELAAREQELKALVKVAKEQNQWDAPKFSTYKTQGGENYRELLITIPAKKRKAYFVAFKGGDIMGMPFDSKEAAELERQKLFDDWGDVEVREGVTDGDVYKSGHWDERNVLVHIRFDERTTPDGVKTLLIDEVQSDWHQAGRKKGYKSDKPVEVLPKDTQVFAPGEKEADLWTVQLPSGHAGRSLFYGTTREEAEGNAKAFLAQPSANPVPDAPFKSSWPMLGVKRAIRWAVDNGFDRVAWTPGEKQAERYNLSSQVDAVTIGKDEDGYKVLADLDNQVVFERFKMTEAELEEAVGTELTKKAIEDLAKDSSSQRYEGVDLEIGGEGMKGFYDKKLVNEVNKYLKKYKTKVQVRDINTVKHDPAVEFYDREDRLQEMFDAGDITRAEYNRLRGYAREQFELDKKENRQGYNTQSVWSFDIPEKLRDDVLQGQMLYSRAGDTLTVSPERLNTLLREFGYAHRPNQSKGWIAWVNPKDFLKSAVPGLRWEKEIESEAGTFDPVRMSAETQTPFVQVRDNRIVGHEGRHRLAAAANAGVKKVAIVLRDMGDNQIIDDSITLHGQDFGPMGRGQGLVVEGARKLSYANADMLDQEFDGDNLYSFAGVMGTKRELTEEQRTNLRNLLKELDTAEDKLTNLRRDPASAVMDITLAYQDTARIRSELKHEITPLIKPSRIGPSIMQIVNDLMKPKKDYGDIGLAKSLVGKEDMDTIREKTGWHKAPDGKWRYEISDENAFVIHKGKKGQTAHIGDILIHDELFAVYPELRGIEVVYSQPDTSGASFSPDLWQITLGPGLDAELRKSVMHELQHAVQHLEGFARGGSVRGDGTKLTKMVDKRKQDSLRLMEELERKLLKGNTIAQLATKAEFTKDKKDLIVLQKAQDKVANAVMNDRALFDIAARAKMDGPGSLRMYESLFGEQEARMVEERIDMTEKERAIASPTMNYDKGQWTFPEFVVTFNKKEFTFVPNPWKYPKAPEPSPQMDLLDSLYSMGDMFDAARRKVWTKYDTIEEMNDLGYAQQAYLNYVDMFATMEAKNAQVKDMYDLAESKRGAKLDEINNRFAHPLRDLIGKSGRTLEQVNDWIAARHILLDDVNRNMSERASYQFAKDLLPHLAPNDKKALKAELDRLKKRRDTNGALLTDKQIRQQAYDLVNIYVEKELPSRDMRNQGIQRQVIKWRWKHFKEHASGMFRPELDANGNRVPNSTLTNDAGQPDAYEIYHALKDDPVMQEIAGLFDSLTRHQLDLLEEGGLITAKEKSKLLADKDHYAPLRREAFDYESAFDFFNQGGQGGKGLKARMGTDIMGMKPVHVVENALARAQGAASRAQRNLANNFLYEQIIANRVEWSNWFTPNTVHKRTWMDSVGFSQRGNTPNIPREDIIVIRKGKRILLEPVEQNQRAMTFAAAVNRLDAQNMGSVSKVLNFVNSIVRFTAITASVPFLLANTVRDPLTAAYNIQASEAEAYTKEIFANYGRSFKALRKTFLQGLRDPADPDTQMVERWERAGGRISFVESLKEMESGFRGFQKDVWMYKTPGVRQIMRMFDGIESANIAIENVMRLATFDTLMTHKIDEFVAANGRQPDAAEIDVLSRTPARIAKDLTTNFSRKGFKSQAMGTLYLFFNATVQGNVQVVRNLMGSKKLQGAVAGTLAFAILMDMMGRALSDDDEDGEKEWDKIPRYEKERNIVLPFKVGGEYIKIPAPWVYNVVWRLGGMIGENVAGVRSMGDTAADTMAMTLTSFNPMGGPTGWQMLAPTAMDPFIQVLENKDFAGNKLRPENFPGAGSKADAELAWNNTPEPYKKLSRMLNEGTGGNIVESGWIDVAPSTFENFVNFLGGGLYRFGTDIVGASKSAMDGDLERKQVPILKQFSTRPTSQIDSQLFYDRTAKVMQLERALKEYRTGPNRDMAKYQELKDRRGSELRMVSQVKDVERQLKSLRQRLQLAEQRGDRERVEELRDRMDSVRRRFNQTYNRRVGN